MNVSLPKDLVDFVKDEAAKGGYCNESGVVCEGLRLLRERNHKRSALCKLLAEGHADAAAGRVHALTDDLLGGVAERARVRAPHA